MKRRHRIFLDITLIYLIMHNCAIYPLEIFNKKTTQASILNVEPAVDGNYFIYTTDGPMTNRNSLLLGKFNAHDIQTYIFKRHDDGDSLFCQIQTAGFRMYGPGKINSVPNITSIIC